MTDENKEMTFRRIYAVPDIHGRNDLLQLLLKKLYEDGYDNTQDLLVFLGDMIDRGPDSNGVLTTIKKLCESSPYVQALYGNHDDFAVNYYANPSSDNEYAWMINGGHATRNSYPGRIMSNDHVRWIASLPLFLVIQGFFFSHAPVPKENDKKSKVPGEYTRHELIWHYEPHGYFRQHEGPMDQDGDKCIGVAGHIHAGSMSMEPSVFDNYRLLDTGCGCFNDHPLVAHECISNRTIYAKPGELK